MKLIRYFLEAILLSLILLVSKLLPVQWASAAGGWLGRTIGPRLAASRKALKNINYVMPDIPDTEAQNILNGMWDNLGRVMMEYPHLQHIGRERTEIVNKDILEKHNDGAAMLFSGHLGNWEACPPGLILSGNFEETSIYRAPNNPFVDALLKKARSVGGRLKTIPKSKTGTRHIVKALNEGQHIGMLIDQKYNEGIEIDFLGRPAMTSPIFVQLAQKFNIPLIPIRVERLKGPNFRLTILPPIEVTDRPVEDVIKECHDLFETWVKDKPEQWLWLHRRWSIKQLEGKNAS